MSTEDYTPTPARIMTHEPDYYRPPESNRKNRVALWATQAAALVESQPGHQPQDVRRCHFCGATTDLRPISGASGFICRTQHQPRTNQNP